MSYGWKHYIRNMATAGEPDSQRIKAHTETDNYSTRSEESNLIEPSSYSAQSYIQACPIELLNEIFLHFLTNEACKVTSLLTICKSWYHIIVYSPIFWTKIRLSISKGNIKGEPSQLCFPMRHLRLYLNRSKNMPLDIHINWATVQLRDAFNQDECKTFLDLLRQTIHRWRFFEFILPVHYDLSREVCKIFQGSAPNLVELHLRNFEYRATQSILWSDLPKMKVMTLDSGYAMKEMVALTSFPALTALNIDLHGFEMHMPELARNWAIDLSSIRSLISLDIRNTRSMLPLHRPANAISLPLLQRLGIWNVNEIRHVPFDLPALQSLTFDCTIGTELRVDFAQVNPVEVILRLRREEEFNRLVYGVGKMAFLKAVILQYRDARNIVFQEWMEDTLVDALSEMKLDGTMPIGLTVYIVGDKTGRRALQLWDAGVNEGS